MACFYYFFYQFFCFFAGTCLLISEVINAAAKNVTAATDGENIALAIRNAGKRDARIKRGLGT
jgi:hypothetical protein